MAQVSRSIDYSSGTRSDTYTYGVLRLSPPVDDDPTMRLGAFQIEAVGSL